MGELIRKRHEDGITLLALIVTIIVILILATITLNLTIGENGLFKMAVQAKDAQKIAEYVNLLTNITIGDEIDRIVNEQDPDIGKIVDLINNEDYVANTEVDEENKTITVTTDDGYILDVVIKDNGDVEIIPQGKDDGEPFPQITLSAVLSDDSMKVTITAVIQESKNGITKTEFNGKNSKDYNSNKDIITETFEVDENGTYTVRATSSKGKIKQKSIKITSIRDISDILNNTGAITFGTPTWSEGYASLEISKTEPVTMQYQINSSSEGGWKEYTSPLSNLDHGDTVYARLFYKEQGGKVVSTKIEDKINPLIEASIGEISTNSIQITGVSSSDLETGIPPNVNYTYEFKEATKANYELGAITSNTNYNFTELKQSTTYNFRITVTDNAGNTGEKFLIGTTGSIESGKTALQFGTPEWSSGKAKITVSKVIASKPSTIQYQINGTDENSWETYTAAIGNLSHGDKVYARLWDGVNAGETASFDVTDSINPTSPTLFPTGTSGTNGWYTSNVTVKITAGTDSQTGVSKTTYTITGAQSKSETEIASGGTISITVNGTSTITAYTYDNAGNKSTAKTLQVKKDSVKPVAFSAGSSNITLTGFTITGSTTDATSGIAKYEYYVGGTKQTSNVITGKNEGTTYTCYIRAYDNAGNYTDSSNVNIKTLSGVKTDGSWNTVSKVNNPKLGTGMTAIYWNGITEKSITSSSAQSEWNKWYDYKDQGTHKTDGKTSKWANAKTSDGSYWVWIPRYEYKIVSGRHSSTAGEIDVKFIPTSQTTADTGYKIHPAFVTNTSIGGFGTELAGIWVAKFEACHADATSSSTGSSTTMKILPGVQSWRNITVNDMYNKAYNYNRTMESHFIKNSEWGAVAYLTHSQYGRNGNEVTINNNSNHITGMGGDSISASQSTTTNAYNTVKGQLASTTGNIYGVYDMSGGSFEYTASYLNNGNENLTKYGSALVNAAAKYKSIYSKGSTDNETQNYASNSGKDGHALYETSSSSNGLEVQYSWFQDVSYFPNMNRVILDRGGYFGNETNAGVFYFSCNDGHAFISIGFRAVLAPL